MDGISSLSQKRSMYVTCLQRIMHPVLDLLGNARKYILSLKLGACFVGSVVSYLDMLGGFLMIKDYFFFFFGRGDGG